LGRGLGVAGSYAKVLLEDEVARVYAQFGPLTAYPRAQQTRDLYPSLPDAPLPAVITCIRDAEGARRRSCSGPGSGGLGRPRRPRFTAVGDVPETAPTRPRRGDAEFWESVAPSGDRRRALPGHAPPGPTGRRRR
jgi:hypothetical protein